MDSQGEQKQSIREEDPPNVTTTRDDENINKSNQDKDDDKSKIRKAMAKRGLKSLAVMITVPTLLTLAATSTCFSGSKHTYDKLAQHSCLPPPWALHSASLVASVLMGLSAWLVWANGGFHRRPRAFQVYVAWLLLNVAWNPIVLGYGATRVGLVVGFAMVGALVWCFKLFKDGNPVAGKLVTPCLALSGLIALVNLQLVFT